ncbi:hypothetical protein [Aureispira anguillae]|uniref:Uncharacterized protein n=1 Tax=Aureispira anguillae TaxID=2864201 RepID=A0A915YB03_9BACT|nr:hypothetical protein [Aureispira anguillae]BDS09766.1 hypothetical protein AsAng_0004710 [Aureispira anguillae]
MTTLCSISTVNATASNNIIDKNISDHVIESMSADAKGGPRDVVQTMTDVTVLQTETNHLHVTVIKTGGEVMYELTSENLETTISTNGWESGDYIVETVDDLDIYQEFSITVD